MLRVRLLLDGLSPRGGLVGLHPGRKDEAAVLGAGWNNGQRLKQDPVPHQPDARRAISEEH